MGDPILLLAASPRSGSTWIQRCLTSTKGVLIWGETAFWGFSDNFFESFVRVLTPALKRDIMWSPDQDRGNNWDLHELRRSGPDGMWMAVLHPLYSDLLAGLRLFAEETFGKSALREGYPRWGIKETFWNDRYVPLCRLLWPNPQVVYLVRGFDDSFRSRFSPGYSQKVFSREDDIKLFCSQWCEGVESALSDEMGSLLIYEKTDWDTVQSLARHLGLPPVPDSAFGQRVGGSRVVPEVAPEDSRVIAPFADRIALLTQRIQNAEFRLA